MTVEKMDTLMVEEMVVRKGLMLAAVTGYLTADKLVSLLVAKSVDD